MWHREMNETLHYLIFDETIEISKKSSIANGVSNSDIS